MLERVSAGDGQKDHQGYPLTILPKGFLLHEKYRIDQFHKMGGMSLTYRALDGDKPMLVKEVPSSESNAVLSLSQERSTLERLDHPQLVKAYDIFEEHGFYYLVVDFIEGQSLDALVSPFPDTFLGESVVLDWALQLCGIFDYLHGQSPPIIYRDLKPKNVLKRPDGKLVLVDFGIARLFKEDKKQDTSLMGSAITASPEHYGMSQTDARSDIYTLGATLHFLLSNGRGPDEPFRFTPIREINPKVSKRLESVIEKAVKMKPDERYQSVAEMKQALLNSRRDPLPTMQPLGAGKTASQESQESQGAEGTSTQKVPVWAWVVMASLAFLLFLSLARNSGSKDVLVSPTPAPTPESSPITLALEPTPVEHQTPGPQVELSPVAPPESVEPKPVPRATRTSPAPRRTPKPRKTTRPRPSLGGESSNYPTANRTPKNPPELVSANPASPVPTGSQLITRTNFSVMVPAGFEETNSANGRQEFQAENPPRRLVVWVHRAPTDVVERNFEKRLQQIRSKGASSVSVKKTSAGRSEAHYQMNDRQVEEVLLRWPNRPAALHLIYAAPKSVFSRHRSEWKSVQNSVELR